MREHRAFLIYYQDKVRLGAKASVEFDRVTQWTGSPTSRSVSLGARTAVSEASFAAVSLKFAGLESCLPQSVRRNNVTSLLTTSTLNPASQYDWTFWMRIFLVSSVILPSIDLVPMGAKSTG
jgi:hypothetical protein